MLKTKPLFTFLLLALFIFSGSGYLVANANSSQLNLLAQNTEESDDGESFGDDEDDFGDDEDDFGDDEDEGDGFEDIVIKVPDENAKKESVKQYSWGGFYRQDIAYSYEDQDGTYAFARPKVGFSKFRSTVNMYYDYKFENGFKFKATANVFQDFVYQMQGRDAFNSEIVESMETEMELRDTYLEGELFDNFWFRAGKQIIAWGVSDSAQIIDIVNPRDNRELGQADLEDIRIAVGALKLSYTLGEFSFDFVAIPEIVGNKTAPKNSDFDTLIKFRNLPTVTIADEEIPSDTEFIFSVAQSFNGGDWRFLWGSVYDDSAYIDYNGDLTNTVFTPKHQRINVTGLAANIVSGSWLYKAEAALVSNGNLLRSDYRTSGTTVAKKNSILSAAGFEYTGVTDLTVSFEVNLTQIQDYETGISNKENIVSSYASALYDTLNQTLSYTFVWLNIANNNGDVFRVNVSYDLMDAVNLSASLVTYHAIDSNDFLYPYRNADRLIGTFKYSF